MTVNTRMNSLFMHNMMRPDCTTTMLREGCALAAANNLSAVCVRPCDTSDAVRILKETDVSICTAVSFPHGSSDTAIKVAKAQRAIDDGAKELMVVLNIGRLLSEKFDFVEQDLRAVVTTAYRKGVSVCAVLETCFLNDFLLQTACRIAENAGASEIVTSTGYGTAGASESDVAKIKAVIGQRLKCIANGGIKTLEQCIGLVSKGADRVCTGLTAPILDELARALREAREEK